MKRGMRDCVIVGIAMCLPVLAAAETTKTIRMRVVESGTGKPVAGAEARYRATATEGTLTGHGGRTATLFELKTESDANGTITFSPTKFNARIFGIFGMNTNYENATMTITRSGYEPLELSNSSRIFPNLDEVIAWEHNGRTVELKRVRDKVGQSGGGDAARNTSPPPVSVRKANDALPQHRGMATQP